MNVDRLNACKPVGDEKCWFVSIAAPYYKNKLAWTAATDIDYLSADCLARLDGKNVGIARISAVTQKEAIEKFKAEHPEFKKHFRQMDKEDIEISW